MAHGVEASVVSMIVQQLQHLYHQLCPRLVVTKRLYGLRCRVNINDHLQWLVLPEHKSIELGTYEWVRRRWGTVWDVGSNFGFYSLVAAKQGNRTVAFDLSPSVLALLQQSSRLNAVAIECVPRAMTVTPRTYAPPTTSSCKNSVADCDGELRSLTYLEAAEQWGVPNFIKMDIEGGEKEFLESSAFCKWLVQHGITLCVELHNGYCMDEPTFAGMTVVKLDGSQRVLVPVSQGEGRPGCAAGSASGN